MSQPLHPELAALRAAADIPRQCARTKPAPPLDVDGRAMHPSLYPRPAHTRIGKRCRRWLLEDAMPMPTWLTIPEVAIALDVSRATAYRIANGENSIAKRIDPSQGTRSRPTMVHRGYIQLYLDERKGAKPTRFY